MTNVVTLEFRKCCVCSERATKKLELTVFDENGPIGGPVEPKHYCDEHFPSPLGEDDLRLLVDRRDKEIESLKSALRYGVGSAMNELVAKELPLEWSPESGIGMMLRALGCDAVKNNDDVRDLLAVNR